MNIQKRGDDAPQEEKPQAEQSGGKKPVVVYIMILFIVAFLLMALSFLMHQRSNTEALGELQNSVTALQEVQATQDENLQLQEQLDAIQDKLQKEIDELEDENAQKDVSLGLMQDRQDALLSLYTLMQQYANGEFDACRQTIQTMEDAGMPALLEGLTAEGATAPAQRYQQLKEAVIAHN